MMGKRYRMLMLPALAAIAAILAAGAFDAWISRITMKK